MSTKSALKRKLRALHRQQPLVRIPAPPTRPWQLNAEEVALVKNHIAKGATDEELKFCLAVARRYKLDPFRGQIWFVRRKDQSADGGARWIPITGINGLQHIAARDHKDYGSIDEPEFGPMHQVTYQKNGRSMTLNVPEWAKVAVWKKESERATTATVWWDEIYTNIDSAPLVRKMPRLMLAKCARAQAIRAAYPATDGLYIQEEFQGPPEYTESGRRIVHRDEETPEQEAEHNPHLKKFLEATQLSPAQAAVAAKRIEELKSSQPASQHAANPGEGIDEPESEQASPTPGIPVDRRADWAMVLQECIDADSLNQRLLEARQIKDEKEKADIKAMFRSRAAALALMWSTKDDSFIPMRTKRGA